MYISVDIASYPNQGRVLQFLKLINLSLEVVLGTPAVTRLSADTTGGVLACARMAMAHGRSPSYSRDVASSLQQNQNAATDLAPLVLHQQAQKSAEEIPRSGYIAVAGIRIL